MSIQSKLVCLVFLAALPVAGCDRSKSSARRPKQPGPSIEELADQAKLLRELIGTEAFVCAFSGTCLEVWLECEIKEGETDASETYSSMPVVITRHSCQWAEKPGDIRGKVVVWGDVTKSPFLRILVKDSSGEDLQASSSSGTLHMPSLPEKLGDGWKGGASSGGGFQWECPSELPGEGEEFTIASFQRSFWKHRGELPNIERASIRESTLMLKGRCLPMIAPDPAPEEQQAVAALRNTGAAVFLEGYQGEYFEGRPKGRAKRVDCSYQHTSGQQPQVTDADLAQLRLLPGLESLRLWGTHVSDEGLAHLNGLADLQTLDLQRTEVTDAGLVHLKGLIGLQSLNLQETQVADQGLAHLSELTSLRELRLYGTRLTDTGLEHVRRLSNLELLHLGNTQVTDVGVEHLKELTNLRELFLGHTQITDAGLEQLKELAKLRWLSVHDTQVTDAGLEHVQKLTNLEILNLSGPGITDAGLVQLTGLTKLENLFLRDTQVTNEGVAKLQEALPHCEISQ